MITFSCPIEIMANFSYTKIKDLLREVTMKKTKLYKTLCLTLGLGITLSSIALQGASITRTLRAVYSNIAISYNGEIKKLDAEPFTVDSVTYLPLRAIGEVIGADVSWANNTVYINQKTSSYSEQQIADINVQNIVLKKQIEELQKKLEVFEGTSEGKNLTTEAINSTLSRIQVSYKNTHNVEWTYDLKMVSGALQLTVSYDSRYDEADYDRTTSEQRKQLVKDVCMAIAAAHKEVEIKGILKNNYNNLERASFRYSRTGSYEYSEVANFSLGNFEKELEKNYAVINCIGFSIPIEAIDLDVRDNKLTFTLTTSLRPSGMGEDYRSRWNSLTSENKNDLKYFLRQIKVDIEQQYDTYDEISGAIRDNSTGNTIGVYTHDQQLYLNTVFTN